MAANRLPDVLLLVILVVIGGLQGCEEKNEPPKEEKFLFEIAPSNSSLFFAGLPALVILNLNDPEPIATETRLKISYGDGDEYITTKLVVAGTWQGPNMNLADGRFQHTYKSPGLYHVQLSLANEGTVVRDTTITVYAAPRTIGSKYEEEQPLMVWQAANSQYHVIYDKNVNNSNEHLWSAFVVSPAFDSLGNIPLFDPSTTASGNASLVKPSGNIVIFRQQWFEEYSPTGELLLSKVKNPNGIHFSALALVDDQYLLAGDSGDYNRVLVLDNEGERVSGAEIVKRPEGASSYYPVFTPKGDVVSCFSLGMTTRFFVHDLAGNLKTDKTYNFLLYSIHPIIDGFIFTTHIPTGFQFVKTDEAGNILWRLPWNFIDQLGGGDWSIVEPLVVDGFVYFFYEYMKVIKVDAQGNVLWQRHLGSDADKFRSVIVNKAGNFTVVGSRSFDIKSDNWVTGNYRDVVLMEIDKNGNIIDH